MARALKPLLIVVALLVAGVVAWALGYGGEGGGDTAQEKPGAVAEIATDTRKGSGPPAESFGISGIIEYTVMDADGKIKDQGIIYNTTNDPEGLDEILALTIGTAVTGTSGKFDGIAALCVAVGTDNPNDGTDAASICDNLDGSGDGAGLTKTNPQDGTVAEVAESGNGTIVVTFVADGGALTVDQIVLTKAATFNNAGAGGVAIVDSDIVAYQDVPNVSLADGDSVQYRWTLDVE